MMLWLRYLLIFAFITFSEGFRPIGAIRRTNFVKMSSFEASKTAVVLIEYQNDFTTEGGKLYEAVKPGKLLFDSPCFCPSLC